MSFRGAQFKKADVQIHSPRDPNWEGVRPEEAGLYATVDEARRAWARNFIGACERAGLQIVALTDHHEAVYVWPVAEELRASQERGAEIDLWIMPGMELTTKDSAQALLLFDADVERSTLEKARSILRLPANRKDSDAVGLHVDLLDMNLEDLQLALESDHELRGRFIILPNVTPGGHKTVLRTGFHRRFRDMPYIGGYLDRCYPDALPPGDRQILLGGVPAWTSKRRGIVSTSDARQADFHRLGEYATWIKVAEPTAESFRQAMLAADSRLRYREPVHPSIYIETVAVTDATFLSITPLVLSSQYNAIIGGRGAGKSTLLEYIRFAIGRSAFDSDATEWDPTHSRRRSLLETSLDDESGVVSVTVVLDGARIRFRRTRKHVDVVTMVANGQERVLSVADVRKLISIQVFSQGELSHLGQEKAERRLLELVTDPFRDRFEQIEDREREAERHMAAELQRLVRLWNREREVRAADAEIGAVEARITALMAELSSGPTSAQEVVEQHEFFEQANDYIGRLGDSAARVQDGIRQLREAGGQALRRPAGLATEFDEVVEAVRLEDELLKSIGEAADFIARGVEGFERGLVGIDRQWRGRFEQHMQNYRTALDTLAGRRTVADQVGRLNERLTALQNQRATYGGELERLSTAETGLREAVELHVQAQQDRHELTATAAAGVEEDSNGLAQARIASAPDGGQVREALQSLFAGSKVREHRLLELLADIKADMEPRRKWWTLLEEVIVALRWMTRGLHGTHKRPDLPMLDGAIDKGGLERFCERLTAERVLEAMRAKIRPRLEVVQKRGDNVIEFQRASQGEKAATLLTILMRQNVGPLIIDQPEEDLDNRIIGDVVAAVGAAKEKRQLIFATHNANLVVNGDAEFVVELAAGSVSAQGAIDHCDVRESITETMEGGKDAFNLRRQKYNF